MKPKTSKRINKSMAVKSGIKPGKRYGCGGRLKKK